MDEYETVNVQPNMLNLMNLHTIIYNKRRENTISLVEGVNPRVPNDTSEIQEELNSIMVDHLRLDEEDEENTTVTKFEEGVDYASTSDSYPLYVLKVNDKAISCSKSRMALLICGSNLMNEENGYGSNIDIVKL
jgi:hypothetical protein